MQFDSILSCEQCTLQQARLHHIGAQELKYQCAINPAFRDFQRSFRALLTATAHMLIRNSALYSTTTAVAAVAVGGGAASPSLPATMQQHLQQQVQATQALAEGQERGCGQLQQVAEGAPGREQYAVGVLASPECSPLQPVWVVG